jgi:hypothetical protein
MRLPHRARALRPSTGTDAYGDPVDGALEPVGEAFAAWLQQRSSVESSSDGGRLVTAHVLYFRDVPFLLEEDDVIEVRGKRYVVDGEAYLPESPRGRSRYNRVALKSVSRGGA